MRKLRRLLLFCLVLIVSLITALWSDRLFQSSASATEASALLQPAPTQPIGSYDYFGQVLSPDQAAKLVASQGLNPKDPISFQRIGAVQITQPLLNQGEQIFFNREIGDTFGFQAVLGFGQGLQQIFPELQVAIQQLQGQATSNLKITLQKDLVLGGRPYPAGTEIPTGLDVEAGSQFPIGLKPTGEITCAICHVTVSPEGKLLKGVPNGDLGVQILVALATNSASGFARLAFNPLDPKFQGNGATILDSNGQPVKLPDPQKFETAFDAAVLDVPFGHFESSPDGISNTTQIPPVFTFKSGPYGAGGEFIAGPFAGLSSINNGVHSSEINILAAAQLSAQTLGIDPEVYLGTALQNAADTRLHLPPGPPVKPSEWLRFLIANPAQAELEDQIPAPGAGTYPNLKPSLFTYNGLVFSPNTGTSDIASGPFLFAANAMAAWQNSLIPPPNKTPENQQALTSGSVQRGARVFQQANCQTCHIPPFFTDNKIHPLATIQTNPIRGQIRLGLNGLLVASKIYSLNTPVPIPANAEVLDVPTSGFARTPTSLPDALQPDGGYKTPSLRGLYVTAPYLHDGGVAVAAGALEPGTSRPRDPVNLTGLGLPYTLSQNIPADPANSLRALVDRQLRAQVVAVNKAGLASQVNLDGTGHNFFVDAPAGYSPQQQTDLVNFLLALDDKPGQF